MIGTARSHGNGNFEIGPMPVWIREFRARASGALCCCRLAARLGTSTTAAPNAFPVARELCARALRYANELMSRCRGVSYADADLGCRKLLHSGGVRREHVAVSQGSHLNVARKIRA